MFNLEKFQADFKAKKFSEFYFYTTLVKESAKMPSPISVEQISISHTEIDSFPVPRFVNLTGEKENFNCTLLIDTETGFLYAPHWFNTNNRTFETIADNEAFIAERVIGCVENQCARLSDGKNVDNSRRGDFTNWHFAGIRAISN